MSSDVIPYASTLAQRTGRVEGMNKRILGLLALMIAAGPAAYAQTTILDYQGYVMGGTSTVLPPGVTNAFDTGVRLTLSTTAIFDAQLTLSGSVSQNDLKIDSFNVELIGNNGATFMFQGITEREGMLDEGVGPQSCSSPPSTSGVGCIALTTFNGAVNGATINFVNPSVKTPSSTVSIGPNGDSFSYSDPASISGCGLQSTSPGSNLSPCAVNVSNPTAGVWKVTSAPEIDASSTVSALSLLIGGLCVLRGSRKVVA
jgi:hypothetical protein